MPCAIILREGYYDIVIETDKPDKSDKLYNIAHKLEECPEGEEPAPWNKKVLEITGELWITSKTAIFKDEATFREKFPGRRVPMRLTLRQAEKTKWYHGIFYEGIRYFQNLALSEDKDLAPISEFPESIFLCPRKSSIKVPTDWSLGTELFYQKTILEHYMFLVELRMQRKKNL